MFEIVLHLIVIALGNIATLASLFTSLCIIATLAISGLTETDYVEVTEFDPETLRSRRRHLRALPPLPPHLQDITPPHTPPLQARQVPQVPQQAPQQVPQVPQSPPQIPVEVEENSTAQPDEQ